ncbi:Ribosomal protein S28e [Nosema bombycis CQ1]|jgi:small subunit ribosomal protein S28e|uniref:Ribosomal protein S28e n=2 Tax=Nosema bombycis TaxID=27978 RepID=R0KTC8_NOSB1|nr:40S ribosomal protein S28e [Nosema bombycis]EOB14066.1 Ribosomal protein S28e [Nosema bombycis CQ1]|eukprot:EOB14066.1 Ribosomal protein S28e [Nosema bombycis CQ1]
MEENMKEQYYATVEKVGNRGGSSGGVVAVKVVLEHNGRYLNRVVKGPIKVGDKIALNECEREERRIR